ncbi:citrate/2-methylcitrate synthase [Virgibacillus ihumii]|uniref:citrate/2-methylcitrate synthase n=1 Tax=Virgibacillus ihumii TaxID=2686091 RepID=UPI00157C4A04|nr:citrate/2-methylcitrate synthase [Virgibacillus ihumii]
MNTRGLKDVIVAETRISDINGSQGKLSYRGLHIEEIIDNYSFEETAFFLLYDRIPNANKLTAFDLDLKAERNLPEQLKIILDTIPTHTPMMDVLRTGISALSDSKAIRLIAIIPTIIAYRFRKINQLPEIKPSRNLKHSENFIYMLTGTVNETKAKILESYMIMTMEHGMNASTFSARVTISTQSDLTAAVTSALETMKGPLHGGAPSGVIKLLDEIATEDRIYNVIQSKLQNNERIMGFGHRVYKTFDPRSEALKTTLLKLEEKPDWIELALKTEIKTVNMLREYKPNQALYTNVEYYAAAIMKSLDLDSSLFTAIFSASRIVGWCAHAIEQADNNTIFRPSVKYIG